MNIRQRPQQTLSTAIVGILHDDVAKHLRERIDKLNRTLNTDNAAATNALRGVPPSDATAPDEWEVRLNGIAETAIKKYRENVEADLNKLAEEISDHVIAEFTVDEVAAKTQAAIGAVKADYFEDLQKTSDDEQLTGMYLRNFRRRHDLLHRSAWYDPDKRLFSALLLAAMFGLDVYLNAEFFEQYVKGGQLEALTIAACLALFNTVGGFFTACCGFRYLGYPNHIKRIIGLTVSVVGLVGAVAINGWFSQVRTALAHSTQAAGTGDFGQLFQFDTLASFGLFVVGLICFGVAAWKGYGGRHTWFDPYPNYAAVDRHYRQAETTLHELKTACRNAVQEAIKVVWRTLLAERAEDEKRHVAAVQALANSAAERAAERLDEARDHIAMTNAVRRRYREINTHIRPPESPPPAYFAHFPTYDEILATFPNAAKHLAAAADRKATAEANLKKMIATQRELSDIAQEQLYAFFEMVAKMKAQSAARAAEECDMPEPAKEPV